MENINKILTKIYYQNKYVHYFEIEEYDKARRNNDGTFTLVKKIYKNVNGSLKQINKNEYFDKSLIDIGFLVHSGNFLIENDINKNYKTPIISEEEYFIEEKYLKLLYDLKENLYSFDEFNNKVKVELASLTLSDKVKKNNDGSYYLVKKRVKKENGKNVIINNEEYCDKSLINIGSWLYNNNYKISKTIREKLGLNKSLRYIKFQEKIKLLKDMNGNLYYDGNLISLADVKSNDKVKKNNNGSYSLIRPQYKNIDGKTIILNHDNYFNKSYINIGPWLYGEQKNILLIKKHLLIELNLYEKFKYYKNKKMNFESKSEFNKVKKNFNNSFEKKDGI